MMKRSVIVVTLLVAVLGPFLPGVVAQAEPLKVGVIVRLDSPGVVLDEPGVIEAIVRQVHQALGEAVDAGRIQLISQEELSAAQHQLGILIHKASKPKDIQLLARALKLNRLVVMSYRVSDHFRVEVSSTVFNARGERMAFATFRTGNRELEPALAEATKTALRQVLSALF